MYKARYSCSSSTTLSSASAQQRSASLPFWFGRYETAVPSAYAFFFFFFSPVLSLFVSVDVVGLPSNPLVRTDQSAFLNLVNIFAVRPRLHGGDEARRGEERRGAQLSCPTGQI